MTNLMLDIETLGTEPNSVILSIGAALFDEKGVHHSKHWVLSSLAQIRAGRTVDPETLMWWDKQSPEAREVITQASQSSKTVSNDLGEFIVWVKDRVDPEKVLVWSNGASFDVVLIESLARQLGLVVPWNFRNIRCYRTARALLPINTQAQRAGVHHNAEHDAIFQAEIVAAILRELWL